MIAQYYFGGGGLSSFRLPRRAAITHAAFRRDRAQLGKRLAWRDPPVGPHRGGVVTLPVSLLASSVVRLPPTLHGKRGHKVEQFN